MLNYELKVFPKKDESGKIYWTALFPQINGCAGGGDTPQEAIKAAEENLNIYNEFLKTTGSSLPDEYKEPHFSGKIAFRTTKSNHKKLAEISLREGTSINSILNIAVERYITSKSLIEEIKTALNDAKNEVSGLDIFNHSEKLDCLMYMNSSNKDVDIQKDKAKIMYLNNTKIFEPAKEN